MSEIREEIIKDLAEKIPLPRTLEDVTRYKKRVAEECLNHPQIAKCLDLLGRKGGYDVAIVDFKAELPPNPDREERVLREKRTHECPSLAEVAYFKGQSDMFKAGFNAKIIDKIIEVIE